MAEEEQKSSHQKILEEALKRFSECVEREAPEREKKAADLRFVTLDQWYPEVRAERENSISGKRPCLTIDKINQYRTQIINTIRKNCPAIKVRGVDNFADPKTAEVIQGITRHIEDISHADLCYETAAEWAIDTGEGYFRFVTEYMSEDSFDQEPRIKPVMNGFSVYLGPHLLPDGSDAPYAFIFEDLAEEEFERRWPEADSKNAEFDSLGDGRTLWKNEKTIRVADYYYYEVEMVPLVLLFDGRTMLRSEYDELKAQHERMSANADPMMPIVPLPQIAREREAEKKSVKWCKLTGLQILEETDWAGKWLPIVKVVGHEKIVDGEKKSWGIVRPAIDSCRMYNYVANTVIERIMLAPKIPYIAAVGQLRGREPEWMDINRGNRPVVQYHAIDVNGNAVPPPQRQESIQADSALISQLAVIEHDIQTSLGMFKASVGQEQGDQSGRAIRALQGQSDTATFHFPDNLARSIRHGGAILIDLIPKIMDTRRVARVLGEDGKARQAMLDPAQPQAVRDIQDNSGAAIKSIYNLNVGEYDVTATIGPSYATGRMEVAEMTQDAMKNNPALVPLIGDLAYKALDNPVADQISERLKKMLPPQLQDQPQGQPPLPPQVIQQMEQMKQGLTQLQQENQQLKAGTIEGMAKVKADAEAKQASLAAQKQLDAAELEIKRRQQQEEDRLAEEKAQREFALKKWVAEQEIAIKDAVANAEHSRRERDLSFQQQVHHDGEMQRMNTQNEAAEKDVLPKVQDTLVQIAGQLTAHVDKAIIVKRELIRKNGRIVGGKLTHADGTVETVQ